MATPKKLIAYCWANGLIGMSSRIPEGALLIVSGEPKAVRNTIIATARHSRVSSKMYVPGIPEAKFTGADPVQALLDYQKWIGPRLTKKKTARA